MSKAEFSADEIKRYRELAAMVIDGDPERKKKLDGDARLCIATTKKHMPTADDDVLATFFSSVAYLVAHIMSLPMKNAHALLEVTFDNYTLAAAHIMGAYDVDSDEMPVVPEPEAKEGEAEDAELKAKLDEIIKRQYL